MKQVRNSIKAWVCIPPRGLSGLWSAHFSLSLFTVTSNEIRLFRCTISPVSLIASGCRGAPVWQCSKLFELHEDEEVGGRLLSPMGNAVRQLSSLLHREESEAEVPPWPSNTSVFRLLWKDEDCKDCGTPAGTAAWHPWGWKGPVSQAADKAWPFSSHSDRAASTAAASKASALSSACRRRDRTLQFQE